MFLFTVACAVTSRLTKFKNREHQNVVNRKYLMARRVRNFPTTNNQQDFYTGRLSRLLHRLCQKKSEGFYEARSRRYFGAQERQIAFERRDKMAAQTEAVYEKMNQDFV